MPDILDILKYTYEEIIHESDWGQPAQYIPELAEVDPAQLAISVCSADGKTHSAGQSDKSFSIQSVSKVFSLIAALGRTGDQLWTRVGCEPSGTSFDSIVLLESERGQPRNPFVNAGAIVTTDALLSGREPKMALAEILGLVRAMAEDDDIHINAEVAKSEQRTGDRNKALAHYLASYGNLHNPPNLTLGTYFHQCAIEMTTVQLARAGRVLAGLEGAPNILSPQRARRLNALMMTCGHYDGSGDFAFEVGLPGKKWRWRWAFGDRPRPSVNRDLVTGIEPIWQFESRHACCRPIEPISGVVCILTHNVSALIRDRPNRCGDIAPKPDLLGASAPPISNVPKI